jgi:polysaccharide biosynthesis protein PslG
MTSRGSRIVKELDPAAAVVCPSFGHLDTAAGSTALQRFTDGGGYQQCNAAGVDLPAASPTEPPETLLRLTDSVRRAFHRAGVQPPLWDTGVEYEVSLQDRLAPDLARDYAARFYLVGLYARYSRMFFYNWGGDNIPLVLQPEGGLPTTAAGVVGALADAVAGAAIYSCGHGPDGDLPARVYRCRFLDPTRRYRFDIDWTESGTATLVPSTPATVQPLGGLGRNLPAAAAIPITTTPIIVRQR